MVAVVDQTRRSFDISPAFTMAVDEENLRSPKRQVEMDETFPLLSTSSSPAPSKVDYVQQHRTRTYFVALVLLNVITLGSIILDPATARIYESAYCHEYYETHDPSLLLPGGVDEIYCKIPQVQRDVSLLTENYLMPCPDYYSPFHSASWQTSMEENGFSC